MSWLLYQKVFLIWLFIYFIFQKVPRHCSDQNGEQSFKWKPHGWQTEMLWIKSCLHEYHFHKLYQSTIHERYIHVFSGREYNKPVVNDELSRRKRKDRKKNWIKDYKNFTNKLKSSLKKLSAQISDECESQWDGLIGHLDKCEANYESGSDSAEFLEILSVKYSLPVSNLSLSQLTA